jgi:hypothetical protein
MGVAMRWIIGSSRDGRPRQEADCSIKAGHFREPVPEMQDIVSKPWPVNAEITNRPATPSQNNWYEECRLCSARQELIFVWRQNFVERKSTVERTRTKPGSLPAERTQSNDNGSSGLRIG